MSPKQVDGAEVAKHNSRDNGVWLVIHGEVYDMTDFLDEHPGGAEIILRYAGKDATEEFDPIHPQSVIKDYLDPKNHIGTLKPGSLAEEKKEEAPPPPAAAPAQANGTVVAAPEPYVKPGLGEILSLHDFEAVARASMNRRAWNYYSSGADDEITMRENTNAYSRVWFRPRILRDVTNVDYSTTILGIKSTMPVYITATALGKLGHPEGEVALTRAAHTHGIIQMIPTLASCSFDEMVDAAAPGQPQFLQLYVNADKSRTKKIIEHAGKRGIKALFITVDAPQLGRREKDMRTKFEGNASNHQTAGGDKVQRDSGAARAISSFIDPSLNWKDLPFLIECAGDMKIILKGVQCWEDAVLAAEYGVDGIVLSNHGGRQLDTAPSAITILAEVVGQLHARGLMHRPGKPKFEIFVDGGVRRATDVLKAVALGATAVGIGRPMLYAMSTYGQEGVEHALQILKDEFTMNMRLIGAPSLGDVNPSMVDTSALRYPAPGPTMYATNYEQMYSAGVKAKL